MPRNWRLVRECIGEETTDPSQLIGWRDRRLEREEGQRQAELERQRDIERRRAAGEIIPEDEAPANTTTSRTRRRRRSSPPPDTRPLTERRMTRAVARALGITATPGGLPDNDTASISANNDDEIDDPDSSSVSFPTTKSPTVRPVGGAMDVDEEELRDVEMVDGGLLESFADEDVQQHQISEPPMSREDQRISQPSIAQFRNILRNPQIVATTAGCMTNPPTSAPVISSKPASTSALAAAQATPTNSSPVVPSIFGRPIAPAALSDAPSNASEQPDMELLDPALFESLGDQNPIQVSRPKVAEEQPLEQTVRQKSQSIAKMNSVQASKIPASHSTIVGSAISARPTITMPAHRPVVARAPTSAVAPVVAPVASPAASIAASSATALSTSAAPARAPVSTTTPSAVGAPAVELEEHTAAKLSEPVTDGNPPMQTVVPHAAMGNKISQAATGQSEARAKAAYQLVPVVDIVNRLFLESLATLQSPTPDIVTSEARLFLARAQENETVGAVKKAATLLSSITQGKIDELTRGPIQFELVSEILRQRLQQVFLQELLK